MVSTVKGALLSAEGGVREKVLDFIQKAISQGCFDAVLIPYRAPGTDSFAYSLIRDESLLKDAYPLPPVMSVQGARAVSSLTGHGKGKKKHNYWTEPAVKRFTIALLEEGPVFAYPDEIMDRMAKNYLTVVISYQVLSCQFLQLDLAGK